MILNSGFAEGLADSAILLRSERTVLTERSEGLPDPGLLREESGACLHDIHAHVYSYIVIM